MDIIGHQKIVRNLEKSLTSNHISHAYVFAGPERVGKFTLARQFAEQLVGASAEKINPDVVVIEPEVEEKKGVTRKKDIRIDAVRELQHKLALSSFGAGYKVAIINDADRLNKAAQNGLLKTLEEPAEKLVLILVAHNEKKLLPTILSRCQTIRFGLVADTELAHSLSEHNQEAEKIIFWSFGRPGILRTLLADGEELRGREESGNELKKLLHKTLTERFAFADEASKDTVALLEKMDLWLVILREAVLGKVNWPGLSQNKALSLIDQVGACRETIKGTNTSVKLVLENLLVDF